MVKLKANGHIDHGHHGRSQDLLKEGTLDHKLLVGGLPRKHIHIFSAQSSQPRLQGQKRLHFGRQLLRRRPTACPRSPPTRGLAGQTPRAPKTTTPSKLEPQNPIVSRCHTQKRTRRVLGPGRRRSIIFDPKKNKAAKNIAATRGRSW